MLTQTPFRQHSIAMQSASVWQVCETHWQDTGSQSYPTGQLSGHTPSQPSDPQHFPVQLGMQSIGRHRHTVRSHQ
jgi:hypothetical protein